MFDSAGLFSSSEINELQMLMQAVTYYNDADAAAVTDAMATFRHKGSRICP